MQIVDQLARQLGGTASIAAAPRGTAFEARLRLRAIEGQ
jgi:hypothetical protein